MLNQKEYAAHRGVSEAAVSKALKAGRITLIDGKIDPAIADVEWTRNTRTNLSERQKPASAPTVIAPPRIAGQPLQADAGPAPGTLAYAQLIKENVKAKRELWASELEQGELLEARPVEAKWAEVGIKVRDEVMALRSRIVNRLPEEWKRQVAAVIDEEARKALKSINHEFLPDRAAA